MKPLRFLFAAVVGYCLGGSVVQAQLKLLGDPDVSKFPTVSFQVNDRDPQPHPDAYFQVKEGEQAVDFELEVNAPNDSGVGTSILIVWEHLPAGTRTEQNKFFRQLILSALPKVLAKEEDVVQVAHFAWTSADAGAKTLIPLSAGFGKDTAALRLAVRDAKPQNIKGIDQSHGSELFPALSEGVAALAATKSRAKALIVLSAEFPNIHNQNVDVSMVRDQARKADVAIYNLRYKQMSDKYTLDNLARETYGRSYEVKKDYANAAKDTVIDFAARAATRALGLDYTFSFESASPKDGKAHTLHLTGGTEHLTIPYDAPSVSLGEWISENMALFIALVVVVLGSIVGLLLWLRKRKQAEAARQAEEARKLEEVKARSQETEQRLQQQNQQLTQMQREEQERQRKAEEAKRREENEREMKALLTEMYANGRQPRLTTMVEGQPLTMELPSAVTTVGRDPGCDIQFNLSTMSRTHFQVIYQNGKYTVLDLGSTNGTSLNGSRIQQAELRHGDEIKAGEAILHFFI